MLLNCTYIIVKYLLLAAIYLHIIHTVRWNIIANTQVRVLT